MSIKTLKFAALAVFVVAVFFLARFSGLSEYMDQEKIRLWIEHYGALGPLLYILLYSIAPVFMFPGLPLTVAGGILFGPVRGSIYVAVGATIGATLAFLVARYMGRGWVEGFIKGGRLEELDREVEKKGWKIVAFTRLIPVFPYNFLNYAFGLTGIKLLHYVLSTFIFMLPGVVAFVVFSSSILDAFRGKVSRGFIIGVILVVIVSLIPLLYKKLLKRC